MHVLTVRPRFGCKKDADVNIGIYEDCKLEDLLRSLELVRGTKRTHRVNKEMLTQAQTNEKRHSNSIQGTAQTLRSIKAACCVRSLQTCLLQQPKTKKFYK